MSDAVWRGVGLPVPDHNFRFCPGRRWMIDYAFPAARLAVEIEGGQYCRAVRCHVCGSEVCQKTANGKLVPLKIGGRHNRGGFAGDMEKYNALTESGWMLLRYQPNHIDFDQIKKVWNTQKRKFPS